MKYLTWNVNGLRAIVSKGFEEHINVIIPDIIGVQEVKMSVELPQIELPGYYAYYNHGTRPGYSGVALFSKEKAISVVKDSMSEGRFIALEFPSYYVASLYAPNAGRGIERKTEFDKYILDLIIELDKSKPVIIGGDFNVARSDKDVYSPSLDGTPGYTKEEREDIERLLSHSFTDVFRYLFPDEIKYTWWSYKTRARERDEGMRIDYMIVSQRIRERVNNLSVLSTPGSDHAPLLLDIAF